MTDSSPIWEPDLSDPVERERAWAEQMAPALSLVAKAESAPLTPEQAEAAWDRILGPLPHSRMPGGARPNLWDYAQKSAPAPELDPIEAEAAWDDILGPSRVRNEWELEDEKARFDAFVEQLAQAIKDRPASKAASVPVEPRLYELSRAEKAALLRRPRPAGN